MICTTLIDGYNVIFGCGLYGKHATAESLAQARHRLLLEIGQRYGKRTNQVTVVFDAQRAALTGQTERQTELGVDVYYSVGYSNADLLIDELIGAHPDPQRLTVVSSDHWVQNAARRRRAKFVDAEAWYYDDQPTADQAEDNEVTGKPTGQSDDLLDDAEKKSWELWAQQLADKPDDGQATAKEGDQLDAPPWDNRSPFPQDYLDELQRYLGKRPPDDA
jgi:predicted RNA-binding protein with PIN domain